MSLDTLPIRFLVEALKQEGIDPSEIIPETTLDARESPDAVISQGTPGDGIVRIPIFGREQTGPQTVGYREVRATGQFVDVYFKRGERGEDLVIPQPGVIAGTARLFIAAAFGEEELGDTPTGKELSPEESARALRARAKTLVGDLLHREKEVAFMEAGLRTFPAEGNDFDRTRLEAVHHRADQIGKRLDDLGDRIEALVTAARPQK